MKQLVANKHLPSPPPHCSVVITSIFIRLHTETVRTVSARVMMSTLRHLVARHYPSTLIRHIAFSLEGDGKVPVNCCFSQAKSTISEAAVTMSVMFYYLFLFYEMTPIYQLNGAQWQTLIFILHIKIPFKFLIKNILLSG